MEALLLILAVFLLSVQHVAQKEYGRRARGGTFTYSLIAVLVGIIFFFAASGGDLSFNAEVAMYSCLFALGYCTAMICGYLAIKSGPMSISTMIMECSLIIPAVYGIAVLGEPLKVTLLIGLVLLVASLILVNLKTGDDTVRPSLKWAVFVMLYFFGNGTCATVQKVQQIDFEGSYKNEFMIVALAITAAVLCVLTLVFERGDLAFNLRHGGLISAGSGFANGLCNYLVMVMAVLIPATVMYPVVCAGGTVVTVLAALLIYKEKISLLQKIGLVLGIVAIVAFNV